MTHDGRLIGFHQDEPTLVVYDREGRLERCVPVDVTEGHGITLVHEDGTDYLWLADNAVKRRIDDDGTVRVDPGAWGGQAVKVTLAGEVVLRLPTPPLAVYDAGRYAPSSIAVDEERFGGSGDIWVADGYGQSLVHRFDKHGRYVETLTGETGAGRLDCPHGIFIDRRQGRAELYVGDRSNRRVQVYGLDGRYTRCFGRDFLRAPCAFAVSGDYLLITELYGRVALCDATDQLVAYLGEDKTASEDAVWPNADVEGRIVPMTELSPGRFRSPHGIATDDDGCVYVSEWLLGGRITKLVPVRG